MNPFRRIWPREIGLYLTALALLAQALTGIAHVAHAGPRIDPAFCAADHEQAPAHAPAPACPLCQAPNFAGPLPRATAPEAPVAWTQIVHAPAGRPIGAVPADILPPARGPPIPA